MKSLLLLRFLSPLNRDYSTIVATRPEPTVRPPSRRQWIIILVFPLDKYAFLGRILDVFIYCNHIIKKF